MAGHAGFIDIPNDNALFVLKTSRFSGVKKGCSFPPINPQNAYQRGLYLYDSELYLALSHQILTSIHD